MFCSTLDIHGFSATVVLYPPTFIVLMFTLFIKLISSKVFNNAFTSLSDNPLKLSSEKSTSVGIPDDADDAIFRSDEDY